MLEYVVYAMSILNRLSEETKRPGLRLSYSKLLKVIARHAVPPCRAEVPYLWLPSSCLLVSPVSVHVSYYYLR